MIENNKILELVFDLGMIFPTETSKNKYRYGLYKCFCGNIFKTQTQDVNRKNTKSCGCLIGKPNITHGLTNHRLYPTWVMMKNRCLNKKNDAFKHYGERGISICDRWLDVKNFIEDMYPSYQEGLTIDRINNDGNYEPSNCRWATKEVQCRNTRKLSSRNITGYRGIVFQYNKFNARISVDNKKIYLGTFNNDINAAKAYDNYVIENNLEHTKNF